MFEYMSNELLANQKKFHILNSVIPISQFDLTDDIMIVISGMVDLSPSAMN